MKLLVSSAASLLLSLVATATPMTTPPAWFAVAEAASSPASKRNTNTPRHLRAKADRKDQDYGNPYESYVSSPGHFTPAEFEPISHIYIAWPRYHYVSSLEPQTEVVLRMIEALCTCFSDDDDDCTKVIIQVPDEEKRDEAMAAIQEYLNNDDELIDACVTYSMALRDDMWIRDMGPVFTKECTVDDTCELLGVDFNFDFWSAPVLATDSLTRMEAGLDTLMYESSELNVNYVTTHMIGEGGNRDFNGQGTLLMNRDVETLRNLKKAFPLERSEEEYKTIFGVTNIVWVDGILSNDHIAEYPVEVKVDGERVYAYNWGTGGHIDEIARFVNPTTILLMEITDEEVKADTTDTLKDDQKLLKEMYKQLKKAVDQDGNPFTIVLVPAAPGYIYELTEEDELYYWYEPLASFQETISDGGKIYGIAATSYLNFVVTNKVVLIPEYYIEDDNQFGTDAVLKSDLDFREMIETFYPDHKIVSQNVLAQNVGGGGMHCITAHRPA